MEFIDTYVEALKGEYIFLKEYYDVFKLKHSGMKKNLYDKLFHEEMLVLIETEQVGEDTYRLLVLTEHLDIKLPSVLDEIKSNVPMAPKTAPTPTPKPTSPTPIAPLLQSSTDPCSRSTYGARSC